MTKNWNTEAEYSERSDFVDVSVVDDKLTLSSGKTSGYVRFRFDADEIVEWKSLIWENNYLYPISKVKVRVRTNDTAELSYDDFSFSDSVKWSSYYVDTPIELIDILYIRNTQYIEIEVYFETTNREYNIPTASNIILTYRQDTTGPGKPNAVRVSRIGRNIAPFWDR